MANPHLLAFRRRHNEDGIWASICLRCYRTAAAALNPSLLLLLQNAHPCDPMDPHAWMSDRELFGLNLPEHLPVIDSASENLPNKSLSLRTILLLAGLSPARGFV